MPGVDWPYSLLTRHKDEVSQKVAANIKTAGPNVDHLKESLKGISTSNIFNYDETNLQDDPG